MNSEIRGYAVSKGVHMYELSKKLGISDNTLFRRFRTNLTNEEQEAIKKAIDEIATNKGKGL